MFRLSNNHRLNNSKILTIFYTSLRWHDRHKQFVNPANVKFLADLLGIDDFNAEKIMRRYQGKSIFSPTDLTRTHAICVKYGIAKEVASTLPNLFFLAPFRLEHRLGFLRDTGCENLMRALLISFQRIVCLSVADLKEQLILPADADVTQNFMKCLYEPPDIPLIESYPDNHTLSNIHTNVLRHYLIWKFSYTAEQVERLLLPRSRMAHQSFSMLKEMVDLLLNEFKFGPEKIRRNSKLLSRSPSNTLEILTKIKYIGNSETKALIIRYPRVLNNMVDTLQEKIRILKEFNVRDESTSNNPEIFTLASKTITRRLIEFRFITELQGHWVHPRFLLLIFYINSVRRRLKILELLKVRCMSLHILCANESTFQRYITIGTDRTKGTDSKRFLCYKFGLEIKDPRIAELKRHSMWCQIPLLHVHETFNSLERNQFSYDDMLKNIHIVLYRRTQIEDELKKIDSMKLDPSWELTPSRKLALCLYNIEKKYHFDGNGIWNCQENESVPENNEKKLASQILKQMNRA